MNEPAQAKVTSESDEKLITLLGRIPDSNRLDLLFTSLKANNPVEQFVRRC